MRACLMLLVLVVGARAFEADEGDAFANEWAAEIQGGEHVARRIARHHGFTFNGLNRVGGISNGFGGILGGGWSGMEQPQPRGRMSSGGGRVYYDNDGPGFSSPYFHGWPRPKPRSSRFGKLRQPGYYKPFYPPPQHYFHSYYAPQSNHPENHRPYPLMYLRPPTPQVYNPIPAQAYYHQPPQIYPPPLPQAYYHQPPQAYSPTPAQTYYHQPPQVYLPSPPQAYYHQPPQVYLPSPPQAYYHQPPQVYYHQPPQVYLPSPPQAYYHQPPQVYYHQPPQVYPPPPPQVYPPPPPQVYPPSPPQAYPPPHPQAHRPPSPTPNPKPPPGTDSQMPSPVTNPNVTPGQPTPSETTSPSNAVTEGDLSNLGKFGTEPADAKVLDTFQGATPNIELLSDKTSAYKDLFTDPLWKKQWYCHDYRTVEGPVMDHNVVPVYRMGETGRGVKVAVVDDGCELHPDLMPNMMVELNFDVNTRQHDATPWPGALHGTRCAGEIAMAPNNSICGVGIAYDAKFAAVKKEGASPMLVVFVEGSALAYRTDVFDIYSNSWGPEDDGVSMDDMGFMTLLGLKTGYFKGRNGKGAIYTFAGGNGRHEWDTCGADAFVNSLYALAIAGASQRGKPAYYSERCSAILATAYAGTRGEERVATVDGAGQCTTQFSGTSAAVPIATGIFALALGANKELISRDIVHLTALTAEVAPLANNPDTWYKNGAGFWVSNDFGFGILNAENMVKLAKKWKPISERRSCEVKIKLDTPDYLAVGRDVVVEFETKGCADNPIFHVESLEEVLLQSVVEYPYRGALSIYLTSPMGTKSALLENRPKDSNKRLNNWQIKSFHNWGENPSGKWTIEVKASQLPGWRAANGYVFGFTAVMVGTAQKPWYHGEGLVPRKYSAFRLPDAKTG